jgi:hypothetical protein
MDKRSFDRVSWRDRSASVTRMGDPMVQAASRPAGGGDRPWHEQVEDGIADEEVPTLFGDQYESVWGSHAGSYVKGLGVSSPDTKMGNVRPSA